MFDLFRSRDKAVRILLGVILGVVALSMVAYLVPGGWLGGDTAAVNSSDTLAAVGNEKISVLRAQQQIASVVRNRNVPPEMLKMFAPQILQGMITQQALAYEAKRLGFDVTDADLANAIRQQLPPQIIKDGVVDREMYSNLLSQQGFTVPQFEQAVRDDLLVSRFQRLAQEGSVVLPAEVQQEYKRRNDKVKIQYALLTPATVQAAAQPKEEDIKAYFDKNKAGFQTPEQRSVAVILIDPAKFSINPTDEDLQRLYNSQKDRFRIPERVKVRHILLKADSTTKDVPAVEAKARDLLNQLKKGADFATLAKANSQDPGSAVKGGELDWIVKGQTVPEFEKAAFSLKPNEISDLVKTTYGYHILQVEARENAHIKPFEEVKAQVAADARIQKTTQMEQQLADKLQGALKKDPTHPEAAVTDPAEQLARVDSYNASEPIAGIGVSPEMDQALTGLRKGEVTAPVALPGNKVAIAVVTGVTPAHPATFESVKEQIRGTLVKQNSARLLTEKAADLMSKARAMNGDLAKAAQQMGIEVKTSSDFDRQGAVEGFGSASTIEAAFSKPDGSLIGPVASADGRAVCKVISHTPADAANLATQSKGLSDELRGKIAQQRATLFSEGIRSRLEKSGKIKINKDAYNRLIQSYRG
jgi:peptidyl-prolyl cis-trans isomerase D